MSTYVAVNTYTHSVTYVTEKILLCLKEIIRESGLDPSKLADDWDSSQRAFSIWMHSGHLESVHLEVFDSRDGSLILRWDFDIEYNANGDSGMWVDTDDVLYHILKAGRAPSQCDYRIITTTKSGHPDVPGWSTCSFRSTDGFRRHAIGTTISGCNGLASRTAYWRR